MSSDEARIKYRLLFAKKTAKLNRNGMGVFVRDILKEFGGNAVLSSVSIVPGDDSTIEIRASREHAPLVHGALILRGVYKGVPCCFREVR
ncbi:hypothetical protein PAPHI01_2101 [Pancytospora philotis]|nr:hypothetical protein PAPHI01_2101 [Pancytospora philotis]